MALYEYSGSGQGVDDMLAEIAMAQTNAILAALDAAGYVVVQRGAHDALVAALEKAMLWTDEENDVGEWRQGAEAALDRAQKP